MCVAVPAQIIDITPGVMPMARVRQGNQISQCCLSYFPEAEPGDYVLIQHGFAMQLLDPQSAAQSLAAFAELDLEITHEIPRITI